MAILGSQRGPQVVIFGYFFGRVFLTGFLNIFFKKNKKLKKWKSSFGPVNYDVSWRSPCRKKQEKSTKNTSEKTSIFWLKIEGKSMKKLVAVRNPSKIDKKTTLGLPFWVKDRFLVDFWIPRGPQNPPRVVRDIGEFFLVFSCRVACPLKWPLDDPGRPQGGPGEAPGRPRGPFLVDFWVLLGNVFQHFLDSFSNNGWMHFMWLGRPRTLDR